MNDDEVPSTILDGSTCPFASVFRLAHAPPTGNEQIANMGGVDIMHVRGPFFLQQSVSVRQYGDGSAGMIGGVQQVSFPEGSFLLLVQEIPVGPETDGQMQARLRSSEVIALFDLAFDALIAEKVFEGVVNRPGQCVWMPEGPVQLTARTPVSADELRSAATLGLRNLDALPAEKRQRLRLMSRWFRRSRETLNQIDRFLFLYLAIEVFPAAGMNDVPRAVRDLLAREAFSDLPLDTVKETLKLGRIAGLRANIVHDGKSFVSANERQDFDELLERLDAIAVECMGLLTGRAYQGGLDRWVRA